MTTPEEQARAEADAAWLRTTVMSGFLLSQIAGTLTRVGAVDALGERSGTAEEVARDTGTHAPSLRRLLRAGCVLGLVTTGEGGRFALTPFGAEFRRGTPARLAADLYGTPALWDAFGALEDAVRTGTPAFEKRHGTGFYESFAADEALGERFTAAMASGTAAQAPLVADSCDWGRFAHVVDVGGGDGTLLAAILAAQPGLHGTLYDRPEALRPAPDTLKSAGVAGCCTLLEGDFLASVPAGGDAYLLRNILHGLDDASCVRVLDLCRGAAGPDGTVLVATLLLPREGETVEAAGVLHTMLSDIETLTLTSGRERTLAEYEELLGRAGLRCKKVTELAGLPCHAVLEAVPDLGA
ncbi:methyltransferase [Streptomyces sulphureus]|uniref:methyltransferase n=1 Tax=Streptomyces sulphureus TaxID=47758 RepID=UPI0003760161|nr:methyltransferase [Streptomyces sulphureus]